MADENAAQQEPSAAAPVAEVKKEKPILFIVLAVFNMLIVAGVGVMLYLGKKKDMARPTIDDVVEGEHKAQVEDEKKKEEESFIGDVIPMETFLVNLAGSRGNKLAKVNLELEVENLKVQEEIEKRKPQIRDIIIIILSSKTYEDVTKKDGKEALREEIRDTINSFLTKGRIQRVFFTEFIVN